MTPEQITNSVLAQIGALAATAGRKAGTNMPHGALLPMMRAD